MVLLQAADAGGHLANGLHSLHDILLHSHILYLRILCETGLRSAADLIQHLAIVSHVLDQILDNNVLHSINTSISEHEKFEF